MSGSPGVFPNIPDQDCLLAPRVDMDTQVSSEITKYS